LNGAIARPYPKWPLFKCSVLAGFGCSLTQNGAASRHVRFLVDVDEPEAVRKSPSEWTRDEDVLDTWFSSWLWPMSTLGWPEETEDLKRYFPTSVLSTSKDIIFFWVARMNFASLEAKGRVPYRDVYIHPTVLDERG
jgi:valyl-tRNA synthetase